MVSRFALAVLAASIPGAATADPAVVEEVRAAEQAGSWRFDVTLSHGDTGWDDYADGWRVELEDGTVLDTRVLLHPHVEEQPFTRSLSGVAIPEDVAEVFVRASTNAEGWSETRVVHLLSR
ncbi:MAG: hypothetical protein QNJ13_02555 [Paracoccaceae bacterium]|nr:hypothetical protein [Paracoccaceae bacterium]